MKRFRRTAALALTAIPLGISLALGLGLSNLARGINWFALSVIRAHVAYPVIQIKRMLAGEPVWSPIDMSIGAFPDGPRQRAAAEALGYVEESVCGCGEPTCENANVKTWIHRDALAQARRLQSMANSMGVRGATITVKQTDQNPPAA